MQFVAESGDAGLTIRCPYHKWGYDPSATENHAEHWRHGRGSGIRFDCAEHALTAVRCEESMGIVFINLSGTAPALSEHLAPLLSRWHELAGPAFDRGPALTPANQARWSCTQGKLQTRGRELLRVLSSAFVHPDLNTPPLDAHYNLTVDPLASGQGTRVMTSPAATVSRCHLPGLGW